MKRDLVFKPKKSKVESAPEAKRAKTSPRALKRKKASSRKSRTPKRQKTSAGPRSKRPFKSERVSKSERPSKSKRVSKSERPSKSKRSSKSKRPGKTKKVSAKEPTKPSSAFTKPIKRLLNYFYDQVPENVTTRRDSQSTLEDILYKATDFLSNYIAEKARNKSLEEINLQEVADAIHELFPGDIKDHAISQGTSRLFQYENGSLVYEPQKPKGDGAVATKRAKSSPRYSKGRKASSRKSRTPKRRKTTGGRRSTKPSKTKKLSAKEQPSSIFRRPIKKMLTQFYDRIPEKITTAQDSQSTLEDILYKAADFLSNYVAESSESNSLSELNSQEVAGAIQELFPEAIKELALAQGTSRLFQYENDLLDYEPKKKKVKKTEAEDKPIVLDFKKGIRGLKKMFPNQNYSISQEATDELNNILLGTCKALVDKVASAGVESDIKAESFLNHVIQLLPRDLAECAVSHANLKVNEAAMSNASIIEKTAGTSGKALSSQMKHHAAADGTSEVKGGGTGKSGVQGATGMQAGFSLPKPSAEITDTDQNIGGNLELSASKPGGEQDSSQSTKIGLDTSGVQGATGMQAGFSLPEPSAEITDTDQNIGGNLELSASKPGDEDTAGT